jgi:hypothetical protein
VEVSQVDRWMTDYVCAWNTNDPEDIGSLFTDGATYSPAPFVAPWLGREEIIAQWLRRRDEPGTFSIEHDVVCTSGEHAVIRGLVRYHQVARTFSNIWLLRFDSDGRCSEFNEWWMEEPRGVI